MILQHASLPVRPGLESEFEASFAAARPIIASGCVDPFPTVAQFEPQVEFRSSKWG